MQSEMNFKDLIFVVCILFVKTAKYTSFESLYEYGIIYLQIFGEANLVDEQNLVVVFSQIQLLLCML